MERHTQSAYKTGNAAAAGWRSASGGRCCMLNPSWSRLAMHLNTVAVRLFWRLGSSSEASRARFRFHHLAWLQRCAAGCCRSMHVHGSTHYRAAFAALRHACTQF